MLGTLRYSCRLQATISFGGCEFLKSSILFWVRELDSLSRQDQPLEFSHTKTGAHSRRVYESGAMVSWSCYFRNSVIKLKWIDKRNFTFHFLFGWMKSKAPQSLICMEQSVCWAHFREDLAPTINRRSWSHITANFLLAKEFLFWPSHTSRTKTVKRRRLTKWTFITLKLHCVIVQVTKRAPWKQWIQTSVKFSGLAESYLSSTES